jgi:hypothetical protein
MAVEMECNVDDPKPQPLQREAEAEDDVVRARNPQRAISFEHAPGSPEHLTLNPWSFSNPFERIESLPPVLCFRVFLGGDGANELEVVR